MRQQRAKSSLTWSSMARATSWPMSPCSVLSASRKVRYCTRPRSCNGNHSALICRICLTSSPNSRKIAPIYPVQLPDRGSAQEFPCRSIASRKKRNAYTPALWRRKEATTMCSAIRYSILVLLSVLVFCFGASLSAQQIRYEDFSQQLRFLQLNGSASFQNYQGNAVLRMTDGDPVNPEAGTVYFQDTAHVQGVGKQQVADGFTTWFAFQIHNETCCSPGDGITFIVQNSSATDPSYGASGFGFRALGAGGGTNQAGALGYAGINNNLVIEFDIVQDPWDPTSNHIAIQTCGP